MSTEKAWTNNIATVSANDVDTLSPKYAAIVEEMRAHFETGQTRDVAFRKRMLNQLIKMCVDNCELLGDSVRADVGGPELRRMFDLDCVTHCHTILDNWDEWVGDEVVDTPGTFLQWGVIRKDPKGVNLCIGPWNFPVGLVLKPLAAMLATGNVVVIKPSEVAHNSSKVLAELIPKYFPSNVVRVVEGAVAETTALLEQKWDHIMYTGNGAIARIVTKAASAHLTPTTLELGGKCPAIIDDSADLAVAAQKLVFSKWGLNCGQACVAPDFILVSKSKEKELMQLIKAEMVKQLGPLTTLKQRMVDNKAICCYGNIVNARHIQRLKSLLDGVDASKIVVGDVNDIDLSERFFPPIVVSEPDASSQLLQQEIFGPILPILTYTNVDDAIVKMKKICDRPLALYIYSTNKKMVTHVMDNTLSGAVGVNTFPSEHAVHIYLPFGGIGESGMGAYGGRDGVNEFSHRRSVLTRTTNWPRDLNMPVPPPIDGNVPSYLFGVAKVISFGLFTRETKAMLRQALAIIIVGGLAAVVYKAME